MQETEENLNLKMGMIKEMKGWYILKTRTLIFKKGTLCE